MGSTEPGGSTKGASRGAEALAAMGEQKVRWVELFYTDLLGGFNHVHVPAKTIDEESFTTGIPKLDGSSVKGFREIYESDMILRPDPSTFGVMPWGAEYGGTARFICDIHLGVTREPYSHDPRGIARRAQRVLADAGFDRSYWGPEIEFFVFDQVRLLPSANAVRDAWGGAGYEIVSSEAPWNMADGHGSVRFKEGYHRAGPTDVLEGLRSEVSNILADSFHIRMDAHHHEVATAGQGEINIRFDELIPAADHVQDVRFILKSVAARHGKVASFMPKPVFGDNGIGMHMNQSIWTGGVNAFYDANDSYAEVSETCRYYVGGLLEHARALCAITNPTTNSYRRLVPGYEAPVFIAWSRANRSANVRIPYYLKGHPEAKRIEYPDAGLRGEHLPHRGRPRPRRPRRDPPEALPAPAGGSEHLQAHAAEAPRAQRPGAPGIARRGARLPRLRLGVPEARVRLERPRSLPGDQARRAAPDEPPPAPVGVLPVPRRLGGPGAPREG